MLRVRFAKSNNFVALNQAVEGLFDKLGRDTLKLAKQNTPIRSGKARKSWTEKPTRSGFEVKNNVPYIEQLEKGRSKQAPRGITQPTTKAVSRRISQTGRLQSGRLSR